METKMMLRYFCSGCGKEYKSQTGCKTHESRCWYLPSTRACPTCKFSRKHEKPVPVDTLDDFGNKIFITAYMHHGYNCILPQVEEHVGPFAEKFNLSVGCPLHKPSISNEDEE